jgi:chemotaxis response regulator CheB
MSIAIVGIGASAGGIESFCELIPRLPAETGKAYVLVHHLDPARRSHLVQILSKGAGFPVEQAREGVKIVPNHLFVIAPNTTLTIGGDVLHTRIRDPAESPHRPIDIFFRSLAEQRGPRAIGIVLSGTGPTELKVFKDQRGRWNHLRAGQKLCSLFRDAKQCHQNGMRRFHPTACRHRAGANTHRSRFSYQRPPQERSQQS